MNIHIYHHFPPSSQEMEKLNFKLNTIMSKITDLQNEVVALTEAVNVEQEQIALLLEGQGNTIAALNATITDLKAQLAESGSPAEIQAVIEQLEAIKTDVESTITPTTTEVV